MKSSDKQLEERGYITEGQLCSFLEIPLLELHDLLKNKSAVMRTIAATILGKRNEIESIEYLCNALVVEKKLYSKIAICDALASYGADSMNHLIPLLGTIGNNQHKKIEAVDLNKKSYPLPRDIVARIIIRIGPAALPFLEDILQNGVYNQQVEAIEAIGHIAFNYHVYTSEALLFQVAQENQQDEFLQWKVVRAMQSFISDAAETFLRIKLNQCENVVIIEEAKRSLRQIKLHRM